MKKFFSAVKRLFSPPAFMLFLFNIISVGLLSFVFANGYENSMTAYISYFISAYTLTADVINFIPFINRIKQFKEHNKYLKRYFSDSNLRASISLYISLTVNIVYAGFNIFVGTSNKSNWFGAIGIYYLILGLIKFTLVKNSRAANKKPSVERKIYELRIYRFIGVLMFSVNIAMSVIAVQMIWQNKSIKHSEIMTIASATFTFFTMATAIINLQKNRKLENPITAAAKMLNFASALMAMFTLQAAMITSFDNGDDTFRQIMNTATGTTVLILVFGMAVYMIHRSNKLLKTVKENTNGQQ